MSTDETSVLGNAFSAAIAPFQGASDCLRFRRAALACPTLNNRRPAGARKLRSSAGTRGRRAEKFRLREIARRGNEGRNAFAPKSPEGAKLSSVGFQPYEKCENTPRAVSARLRERAKNLPKISRAWGRRRPRLRRGDARTPRGENASAGNRASRERRQECLRPQEKLPLTLRFFFAAFAFSDKKSVPAKRIAGTLFFKLQALNFKLFSAYFFGIAGRDAAAIAWP